MQTCPNVSSTFTNVYFWKPLRSWFLLEFQSFIFGLILANFSSFGKFGANFGRVCCIRGGWEHARTWGSIFKTPLLWKRESKCCMQHLIGKLPSLEFNWFRGVLDISTSIHDIKIAMPFVVFKYYNMNLQTLSLKYFMLWIVQVCLYWKNLLPWSKTWPLINDFNE